MESDTLKRDTVQQLKHVLFERNITGTDIIYLVIMLLISKITSSTIIASASQLPTFYEYPINKYYNGKIAMPLLTTKTDLEFRTQFERAQHQKINFAGHYTVVLFGCGTECVMCAIVDAKSEKVSWIPFTICCWSNLNIHKPISFRLYSNLMIVNGSRNERGEGIYYYVFTNGQLRLIKEVLK